MATRKKLLDVTLLVNLVGGGMEDKLFNNSIEDDSREKTRKDRLAVIIVVPSLKV